MTLALVHGNPETAAIWDDLIPHLDRSDIVALSPPGFGAAIPDGFGCASDDYLAWLADAVAGLPAPVDVLGHDWGGGHVLRLAMERPEHIRSWASDIAGCFDPDYVWHERAQTWQTPGDGEQAVAEMAAAPVAARAQRLESLGVSPDIAARVAAAQDETMGRAILALYRSARQPMMATAGGRLDRAAARPGLVIIPTADGYTGGEALARRSAERAGAEIARLEGLGHWWMCEDPARAAGALNRFWDRVSA